MARSAPVPTWRAQPAETEATDDLAWKRRVIELLVARVDVETIDRTDGKKEARLEVRYVSGRPRRLPVAGAQPTAGGSTDPRLR